MADHSEAGPAALPVVHGALGLAKGVPGEVQQRADRTGHVDPRIFDDDHTKLEDIAGFLASHNWPFTQQPWFSTLGELRLLANTVNHARGDSARALFDLRRTLFWPLNRMDEDEMFGNYFPDGANLVVTPDDSAAYAAAIEAFWLDAPAGDEG